MPWGTWSPGTPVSVVVGVKGDFQVNGYVAVIGDYASVETLLNAPFTRGLLEINGSNRLAAAGTSPAFPMLPTWRKTVRQVG